MLESSEGNEVGAGSEAEYQSLLPQSMLMSAEESRSGRSLTRTKLFPPGMCCTFVHVLVGVVYSYIIALVLYIAMM